MKDTKILLKCLGFFTDCLNRANIKYFVSGGTMLGAVRERNIIEHDRDIDIDMMSDAVVELVEVLEELHSKGVTLNIVDNYLCGCYEKFNDLKLEIKNILADSPPLIAICYDGKRVGDLYVFRKYSDGIVRYVSRDHKIMNPKVSIPSWFYEGSTELYIDKYKVYAPRNPEFLLERLYGKSWMIPVDYYNLGRKPGIASMSGALSDASIEAAVFFALERGWTGNYDNFEDWPPESLRYRESDIGDVKYHPVWMSRHDPHYNTTISNVLQRIDLYSLDRFQLRSLVFALSTYSYCSAYDSQAFRIRQIKRLHKN